MARSFPVLLALAILPLGACAQLPFELPQALTNASAESEAIEPPTPKPTGVQMATAPVARARPGPRVTAKAGDSLSGQARVLDGDTIEVAGAQVELLGIDAPEMGQTCEAKGDAYDCGQQATNTLDGLIGNAAVNCSVQDVDFRDRVIATCKRDAVDLSKEMVSQGWAVASYGYAAPYANDEKQASSAGTGIWQGRFDMPWDWRAGIRTATTSLPVATKG